jgi:Domain of unknown function (DUF4922)
MDKLRMNGRNDKIFRSGELTDFLNEQKKSWPLLRDNYDALKHLLTRSFNVSGITLKAQFNPARIRSSSADISAEAVRNRDCFLCSKNLPEEQISLSISDDYLVLCNPYPIFPEHFTIPGREHRPQNIADGFGPMLEIARFIGEKYTLFYNGPGCGASAPDHIHFQVSPRNSMPLESDLKNIVKVNDSHQFKAYKSDLHLIEEPFRRFIYLKSACIEGLKEIFNLVFSFLPTAGKSGSEPMVNIVSLYGGKFWEIVIFPREKHRPDQFYAAGADQFIISPAAVDLSGLIIVPRREDFDKLTGETAAAILGQVTSSDESFARLSDKIKAFSSR